MSERTISRDVQAKASVRSQPDAKSLGTSPRTSEFPAFGLQQTLGNQAMLQLLESGTIQAKLRLSQPGDPDEVEADSVAEKVVARSRAPVIHRKCACGGKGSPCAKCVSEEETIHRSVATSRLRSLQPVIQRAPADPSSTRDATPASSPPEKQPALGAKPTTLVVEDNATKVEPHQMRKSQFIALLRTDACAAADAALASVGHTTKGCPYVAKWLSFYEKQSSSHIERAIRKYAPETATARSPREAIRILVMRIERAALQWAKTGKVEGLPEDLASQLPGQGGFLGAVHKFASSGVGGAILGFIGGTKKHEESKTHEEPDHGGIQRKARDGEAAPAHDAAAVKSQLGTGHSLDSRVGSQMSSAFGHDFSSIRVHTDSGASKLSSDLQARAFTVGSDVAFASGEYRPGTLIGDALIAHELAHVVQQGAADHISPLSKTTDHSAGSTDATTSGLENDADLSAVGAVASIWAGAKRGIADIRENAAPRLSSGLRLQRCGKSHDLEIRGISDPQKDPESIFFDLKSSDLDDADQKDKVQPLKTPVARDLTLYSFVSEDENSPPQEGQKLAKERFEAVNKELHSKPTPHTGQQRPVLDTTSSIGNLDYRSMRKVVVKPAGGASGVAACASGGEIPCSDQTPFTSAQTRAVDLLNNALVKITGPTTDEIKNLLRDRFGATPANLAPILTAVSANLTDLKTHVGTQMTPVGTAAPWLGGHRCANECEPSCKPSFVAYNQGVGDHALMTLCVNSGSGFMNESDLEKRALTLIHEGMHGIKLAAAPPVLPLAPGRGTRDFSYHFQRLITKLDPATALKNTDSYVLLVQQLNGQSPAIGPAAEDPEVGDDFLDTGPGGEREQVDRAIAWVQGWVTWSWQEMGGVYEALNSAIAAGHWPADRVGYYEEALQRIAPVLGLAVPPAAPNITDKFAAAAIHDRLNTLAGVFLHSSSVEIEKKKKGSTEWGKGPAPHVTIGSDFFASAAGPGRNRAQLNLLLLKLLEADPSISSGFRSKYMIVIDKLREHFGGGSP